MTLLLLAILIQDDARRVDTDAGCLECHVDSLDELKGSVHARESCTGCHGADEINPRKTSGNPHWRRPAFKSWRGRNLVEDCGACHVAVLESLRTSGHTVDTRPAKASMKKGCIDCHGADEPDLRAGGRAHGVKKPNRAVMINDCRQCHAPNTKEYVGGRMLFDTMSEFDDFIVRTGEALKAARGRPGIPTGDLSIAIAGAKRAMASLRVQQHGLKFDDLKRLRDASAGPLVASYNSQSLREREFEGRWKALVPFLAFVLSSVVFVRLKAHGIRKGAA
jgi:hypothetical protein